MKLVRGQPSGGVLSKALHRARRHRYADEKGPRPARGADRRAISKKTMKDGG